MSVSEAVGETSGSTPDLEPVYINSLDTERVTALRTNGWLPLSRWRSVGNEGLETRLGTPFESAATAFLRVVLNVIGFILMTTRAAVNIRQNMVLAIDMSTFIAFYLEKVEFAAILKGAAVADVFENGSVLRHPHRREPRSSFTSTECGNHSQT